MKKVILLILTLLLFTNPAFALRDYKTLGPDGGSSITPPVSDVVNNYALVANVASTITWPTNSNYMNISASAPYWVAAAGQTATVPTTNNTGGTGSVYMLAQRNRKGQADTTISIISPTNQVISVEFWK